MTFALIDQATGDWDASTNTPFLMSSRGYAGHTYRITVSGSTLLDGESDWQEGNFVLFTGRTWVQIPTGLGGGGGGSPSIPVTSQAGSYVLQLSDANSVIEFSAAGAVNCTVPPNGSVNFPVNTVIEIDQIGAGQVTLVAGAGVTLSTSSSLTTRAQYSVVGLRQRATDQWVVSGDLT